MKKSLTAFLAVLIMLSGCSGADSAEIDAFHAQIDALNTKIDALSMQIEMLETRIDMIEAQASVVTGVPEAAFEEKDTLDELLQIVVNVLQEYRATAEYASFSAASSDIEVQEALHLQVKNVGSYAADYLMVSVACNNEIYGVEAGKLLIDLSDNTWYDRTTLDISNPPTEPTNAQEVRQLYLWAYSSDGEPDDGIVWTEMEFNTYFTKEELDHINTALMG